MIRCTKCYHPCMQLQLPTALNLSSFYSRIKCIGVLFFKQHVTLSSFELRGAVHAERTVGFESTKQ